uniref:chitin synthase n=1 Tax=Panagrellus redivivus TaxID=6233 RepID=A0A7E4VWA1_PANRE
MDTLDREEAAYLRLGVNNLASSEDNHFYGLPGGKDSSHPTTSASSRYSTHQPHPHPHPTSNGVQSPEGTLGNDETQSVAVDNRGWDIFRLLPPKNDNLQKGFWHDMSLQVLKVSTFFILFFLTLGSAFVAKSSFLLMVNGIAWGGKNMSICADKIPEAKTNTVFISHKHVARWVWATFIALCAPELLCFIRCFHRTLFRNVKRPTLIQFFTVLTIESLHAFGVGLLVFKVLPDFPAETAAMLSNAICLVPSVLSILSRRAAKMTLILVIIDIAAIVPQSSDFWAWPALVPEIRSKALLISISLLLISLAWWQNFVDSQSFLPPVRALGAFAKRLSERKSKTYVVVSLWKCVIYLICLLTFLSPKIGSDNLMQRDPFGEKLITITARELNATQISHFLKRMQEFENPDYGLPPASKRAGGAAQEEDDGEDVGFEEVVTTTKKWDEDEPIDAGDYAKEEKSKDRRRRKRAVEVNPADSREEEEEAISAYNVYESHVELNQFTSPYDALWVAMIQIASVIVCYHSSKFACKVMMQRMGFALPIALTVPLTVFFLSTTCEKRAQDPCHMTSVLSKELFWQCPIDPVSFWHWNFWTNPQTWIWLAWLGSQIWVTIHLWTPKHERLARSEKLFILSYNSPLFIDQSLAFNRRRDDKTKIKAEFQDLEMEGEDSSQTYETIGPGQIPKPPPSVCSASSSKLESGLIRDQASAADAITKIYACATMWHESPLEMTCMLKSIFRLDEDQCARRNAQKYLKVIDPDYYEFEAHIFFDDAFDYNDYGEPVVNKFVKQLIEKMDEAASAVHQTNMRLKAPKKYTTPYGGRISYVLPGKNRLTIHLKNKNDIRVRKRWSQVMYLYYLLGYRLMMKVSDQARKEIIAENTFILTLDGDVDFTPECVHLLVDLMKKNRRLGAACGRIHPRGSGLMIWYQKFEYAVGHWLQKATEHMIGCVLCSPGCFSLFRSYALMDDNVTRKYASKSERPLDYVQYDQGEDRWLCTLLLQRGYRVEYCAASDALTFAPEGFTEFFNQRRRWIPSTLANIIDLLKDYRNVVSVNESISIWYIIYQLVMLISSILGPGTIFLMVVGAISISFNIDTTVALVIITIPVAIFCVVCLIGTPDKQMLCAQIVGALFAMLMTAVIVGTSLQIQKDGIMSPHSIFLFAVIASFMTAAILHPLEFSCIIPGILYFLAIPCMYMLLPIYSICNLNNVNWGTREDPAKGKAAAAATRGKHFDIIESGLEGDADGDISFGCGSACRLLCCLKPNQIETSPQIWKINEGLKDISRKLENLERKQNGQSVTMPSGNSDKWNDIEEDDPAERDDDRDLREQSKAAMRNKKWRRDSKETWLGDAVLRNAERDYLETEEEAFWGEMITKYLEPIAADAKNEERIRQGLTDLRNKVCSAFFMGNVVFIIIVLVLQMQKDCLHIEWPLGPKFNHTIVPCNSDSKEEIWVMTRLQLEPIGLVFLVFFMSILVIQFFAMLMHRFGTLAHIIASTELFCFRKQRDRISDEDLVVQNAVEIARELQAIRGVDEVEEQPIQEDRGISRRRVVQNLESSRRSMMKRRTETLDAAFKKRFFALNSADVGEEVGFAGREKRLTLRKGTIRALEQRRDSLFGGTIDKRTDNPYNSTSEAENAGSRGPAQRRLERIFNQDNGSARVHPESRF